MTIFSKSVGLALCALSIVLGAANLPNRAEAGTEPYLGDIMLVGFNFCPRGWAEAAGQLLPINSNQALFSLLGTTYGGDGRTTFALPDLRGRYMVGRGTLAGGGVYSQGQKAGAESATMITSNMPAHTHIVNANNLDGDKPGPGGKLLAAAPTGGTGNETIYSAEAPNVTMNPTMIQSTGSGQPFSTRDPYLGITHCIALQGIFPSRS